MLARAVLVRLAEVAGHDGSVDRAHDLTERDLSWRARQDVATAHTPFRPNQTSAFEC
jgi:hypothetical protein